MRSSMVLWKTLGMVLVVACAPTREIVRKAKFEDAVPNQSPVTKKSVAVAATPIVVSDESSLPDVFWAEWQADNSMDGTTPIPTGYREPVIDTAAGLLFDVQVTNNADQILRMSTATVVLLDPGGTQVNPATKDDLIGAITVAAHSSPSVPERWTEGIKEKGKAAKEQRIRSLRLFDPNMQVLPHRTERGYLYFKKSVLDTPGTYKLAIYELPTAVDAAGNPTEKAALEFNYAVRIFEEEWEVPPPFSSEEKKLIQTREIK